MNITNDILYLGVNDHQIDLFEGQYQVPHGMAYNSYLIAGEKTAVMDTVDAHFTAEWLQNLAAALAGRTPDYLVVQHMEPDHSGALAAFAEAYPNAQIVASAKAFVMMQQFFGADFAPNRQPVGEGDTLPLGNGHTLHFITAPMVHWPEVIMTYDDKDKVLFTADGFGKFGALDVDEPWEDEARRYYIGIVGKYGPQVQAVLKKAAALELAAICPLHGPVLQQNLPHYLSLYDTWSAYRPECEGVLVAYASIYGHTAAAALQLAEQLRQKGATVVTLDLARCDWAEAVAQAFRLSKIVLASATYNGDVFPCMRAFVEHLTERNYQNRTVALMENGSWAPTAARVLKKMLENSKNLTYVEPTVTIKGALNDQSAAQLQALAEALA